jgi:hypothetical protein
MQAAILQLNQFHRCDNEYVAVTGDKGCPEELSHQ